MIWSYIDNSLNSKYLGGSALSVPSIEIVADTISEADSIFKEVQKADVTKMAWIGCKRVSEFTFEPANAPDLELLIETRTIPAISTDFFQPRPAGHFPDLTRNIPTALIGLMQRLKFSAPATRFFKGGEQAIFRSALVTEDVREMFWANWRRNRIDFARIGLGVAKDGEAWICNQWLNSKGGLTGRGMLILGELMASKQAEESWVQENDAWEPEAKLHPLIESKLYDYQRKSARQLLDSLLKIGGAWDCGDLGIGKTAEVLAAAICSEREIGVICPLAVKSGWRKMAKIFGTDLLFVENYEALRTGNRKWVKTMGAGFTWGVDPDKTVLIWDEAQKLKNEGARQTQLLLAAVREGFWNICASATMATSVEHLFATGQVLKLHDGSMHGWAAFCESHGVRKNGSAYDVDKRAMGKALIALNRKIFPRMGCRVRIKDLGDKFPDTEIICDPITMDEETTKKVREAFRKAQEEIDAMKAKDPVKAKFAALALFTKAYHEAERAKVGAIVDLAKVEIENGRHVPIFMNFDDTREAVMAAFKTKCGIYGGQSHADREKWKKRFQDDDEEVIVCNVSAGGVGVDLHDVRGEFPRTSIICPTTKAMDMRQVFGRPRRAGGLSKSIQRVVWCESTVEEKICENVRIRLQSLDMLNDGVFVPPQF